MHSPTSPSRNKFTPSSRASGLTLCSLALLLFACVGLASCGSGISSSSSSQKGYPADDRILCGEPIKHQLRHQQHAELGGNRGDEYCHYAGDIHLHIGKWFNEHESDGDDHLHADSDQFLWLGHLHGNDHRYGKHARQSNHQLVHG